MDARLRCVRFACLVLPLVLVAMTAQQTKAQGGWGDRSFDTSSYHDWQGGSCVESGLNRDWHFGVIVDNTDGGVVVRQVEPNGSAARSGIIPGDVIVCVAGTQVGRVGNQIFELSEEINRRADSTGRISVLMLDRRLGQLKPLSVQLGSQRGGLQGRLTISGGGRLPIDAVATIRLENQSRPHYQVRNGESSFRLSNFGVGNVPFELNYDPAYISNLSGTIRNWNR